MMASLGRQPCEQIRKSPSSIAASWKCLVRVSRWKAIHFARSHITASGRAEVRLPTDPTFHPKRFANPNP